MQLTEATITTSSRSRSARVAEWAHPVDLLVDRRGLLDIGVGARDVGFGLIIVVVGNEILDRIVRKEALHLAIELGGQDLVGGEDQGRFLHLLNDVRHGEGLAGAGNAEQHLISSIVVDASDQFADRLRLVACRLEIGGELERHAAFWPIIRVMPESGILGERF